MTKAARIKIKQFYVYGHKSTTFFELENDCAADEDEKPALGRDRILQAFRRPICCCEAFSGEAQTKLSIMLGQMNLYFKY